MANRRFFHYKELGMLLGVTGFRNRAELPDCIFERILQLYGDEVGAESMVGFIAGVA